MGVARCRLVPMSVLIRETGRQYKVARERANTSNTSPNVEQYATATYKNDDDHHAGYIRASSRELITCVMVRHHRLPRCTLRVARYMLYIAHCTLLWKILRLPNTYCSTALCHNVCAMWCPPLCDVHYLPLSVCIVPSEAVYSAVLSSFVCSGVVLCGLMLYCIAGW